MLTAGIPARLFFRRHSSVKSDPTPKPELPKTGLVRVNRLEWGRVVP